MHGLPAMDRHRSLPMDKSLRYAEDDSKLPAYSKKQAYRIVLSGGPAVQHDDKGNTWHPATPLSGAKER
ncbi:hypothetical protein SAMN05216387_101341 [Nitrosovibrio tenuis]|uniref:Uncharacterized protein n=1 Tax=Nitrosovibrio tenuis TaxID=1233 RepID=A0A1H7GQW9_9PROT|nr:hypothetical protein SAMN05216387_101341 [Nitrosovibrio tenuis]